MEASWTVDVHRSMIEYLKPEFDLLLPGVVVEYRPNTIPDSLKHKAGAWIEIRIDGPTFVRGQGSTRGRIETNALVHVNESKGYRVIELTGTVATVFGRSIPVHDVDNNRIGCLNLLQGYRQTIQVSHFGIVHAATQIEQSTVEAHHEIKFRSI